jgi:hypothetical protein
MMPIFMANQPGSGGTVPPTRHFVKMDKPGRLRRSGDLIANRR